MPDRFFDTSAVAKHYRNELGTAKVDAFLAEPGSNHFISTLSVVEMHSALARRVRMSEITVADFHLARGRFLADIASGMWQLFTMTNVHLHHAQQLLLSHGLSRSLRTLDSLQLAIALTNPGGHLDEFVSADGNLCTIAASEGLTVVNPEVP